MSAAGRAAGSNPHPMPSERLACKCREIQSHVSEPFWEIKVTYRSDDGKSCDFRWSTVILA